MFCIDHEECFVFDKRLVVDYQGNGSESKPISNCEQCGILSDLTRNCRNTSCDKLFISCTSCQTKFNGCCSNKCLTEFRKQCMTKSLEKQGRRKEVIENKN